MKKILQIISFFTLLIPSFAYAQARSIGDILSNGIIRDPGNPLKEISDVFNLLGDVLVVFFTFSAVVAVIFVIVGGFHYVSALGNPENAQKGKQTITWAVVGLIISIAAYAIVQFVWNTFASEEPPGPTSGTSTTTTPPATTPGGTTGGTATGGSSGP